MSVLMAFLHTCNYDYKQSEGRGAPGISRRGSSFPDSEGETFSIHIFLMMLLASSAFPKPRQSGIPCTPPHIAPLPLSALGKCFPGSCGGRLDPSAARSTGLFPPGGTAGAAERAAGPGHGPETASERPRSDSGPSAPGRGGAPSSKAPSSPPPPNHAGCWHETSKSRLLPWRGDSLISLFRSFRRA